MMLVYTVEPLVPIRSLSKYTELLVDDEAMSFWDFLNCDVMKQMSLLAVKFLKKQGVAKSVERFNSTVAYQTFNTASIHETISKHVVQHMRCTSREPSKICIGRDVHKLMLHEDMQYLGRFNYIRGGVLRFMDIEVHLKDNMNGFFLEHDNT